MSLFYDSRRYFNIRTSKLETKNTSERKVETPFPREKTKFDFVFCRNFGIFLSTALLYLMFQTLLIRNFPTCYGLMLFEFAVITRNALNVVNNVDVSRHQFVVCLLPAPEHNAEQNNREVIRLPV